MEKERIDCARNSVKREASSRAPLMACVSAFELRLRWLVNVTKRFRGKRYNRGNNFPELVACGNLHQTPTRAISKLDAVHNKHDSNAYDWSLLY